ncbi:sugar transferase [Neobacillus novalis]|uniref:Sugar transferase n=1 Tax=Neobacillus novalis TaxID=220687 RepID=A0AA95MPN7_9BACI|nr:sugar transferase [Neobacillus novalis]WHY86079.1 sugar transferase [Neobacillus novalis]
MYKKYLKRLFDIVFSLALLPFLLPVIAICVLFIKIEDKGPVFYLGKRLGKDQKPFKMYKLRSMKVNAPDIRNEDGSTFNSEDDPRLTKVGKFIRKTSLDELPQIINVLIGDMSFIGPRPDLLEALDFYNEEEIHKLDVRPGITGYNQAYFRNSIAQSEKFRNDIFYVNNISAILDIRIIIATIINVIRRKNINIKNEEIFKN